MSLRPMPVVMVSSLTAHGADITLEALKIGAVDFVQKPGQSVQDIEKITEDLIDKIKIAASANIKTRPISKTIKTNEPSRKAKVVAIGASTGETETIKEALEGYSHQGPPVVISQHIPPIFSSTYAQRSARKISRKVTEITHKTELVDGKIYLAQGGTHLTFERGMQVFALPSDGEKINKHRPSVDVMFDSLIPIYGAGVQAFLLTGMGADGAQGLLNLKNAGSYTVAQDEASSIVWGMPRQAVLMNAQCEVMSLSQINNCLRNVKKK